METKKYITPLGRELAIFYGIGVILHMFSFTLPGILTITPIVLAITMAYIVYHIRSTITLRLIIWAVLTYLITFALEAFGTNTGLFFGNYTYGDVLGPKLFETPFLIGMLWVFIILGAISIVKLWTKKPLVVIPGTILLAVFIDSFIEPVAIGLGYWWWQGPIPLSNYIGWAIVAAIGVGLYYLLKVKYTNRVLVDFFIIQTFFFAILQLVV